MQTYNATYYCNAYEYPATVTLEKEGLRIHFNNNNGPAKVDWPYARFEAKRGSKTLTFPGYPLQTLVLLDAALADNIAASKEAWHRTRANRRTARVFSFFALFIGAVMFIYLVVLPWIAGLIAGTIPVHYEKSMGQQLAAAVKKTYTVDEKRTAYINAFFEEMRVPSIYNIQITVVKSDVANAFAMPGGYIVVHDKLLQEINTYPELAALLSHEFVHIENRHSLRSLFSSMSNYIFLSLILGDLGTVTAVVISHTHHLKNLSYSRRLEREADEEGLKLLTERGIDCNGFVRLFDVLKKEAGAEPAEWVSSHPNLNKRIGNIRKHKACTNQQAVQNETLQQLFAQIKKAD